MRMHSFGDLRTHLRTLRLLGVFRFHIDYDKCVVSSTPSEERVARFYLWGVLWILLNIQTYCTYMPQHFFMVNYNATGNCYSLINIRTCNVTTALIYTMLYVRRCRYARLLETMLRLNRAFRDPQSSSLYGIHLTLFVLCMINYGHGYWRAQVRPTSIPIYLFQYGFSYMLMGQLVVLFVSFQRILLSSLRCYNRKLLGSRQLSRECREFYEDFRDYNQIIRLCHEDIHDCFGLLLLPITGYVLVTTPSGPFYLISTLFEGLFRTPWRFAFMFLTCVFWSMPWVTLLVLAMGTTNVQREVSRRCLPHPLISNQYAYLAN
ncbi:gustatory and pheromone receptor 39a-like [Drosophila persimilis]|uniref:gustatory and pheromone receptor 39a-like n=1 Tax=Drosophila persimilis TaxID=7234 RepID=UPI000F07EDC2|nr:gustatory and pheromone receptor 39a-like [Drosophila persimilis]